MGIWENGERVRWVDSTPRNEHHVADRSPNDQNNMFYDD